MKKKAALLFVLTGMILFVRPVLSAIDLPPEFTTSCWAAYAPTHYDPNVSLYPTASSIRGDLIVLKNAGFTGIVTYGATGTLGTLIPQIADELGFEGLIMGIWDPLNTEERTNALAAASLPVTLGYVVGNEGLNVRYDRTTLVTAIDDLRDDTGKPVTTTEEWGDYMSDPSLLGLGDWVFPNVHPYYGGIIDPTQAAEWTAQVFEDFQAETDRTVIFKEVGLPSAGVTSVSPANQGEYYRQLWNSGIEFVYFEAFDQPWKQWTPIEPHWGLFTSARTAKPVTQYVCGGAPVLLSPTSQANMTQTRPTFMWNDTGAASYEVRLGLTNPPIQTIATTTANSFRPAGGLLVGTYYWQVRATDSAGHVLAWSEPSQFDIVSPSNAVPARQRLDTNTVRLSWNRITWATAYEVEVARNSNFTILGFEDNAVPPGTLFVEIPYLADGTWFWRVRAKRANGTWGNWSAVDTFKIATLE